MKALLLSVLVLGACDPAWTIDVRVRDPASQPVQGAAVILTGCPNQEHHDIGTVIGRTDRAGEAFVGSTGFHPPASCVLTIAQPGYATVQRAIVPDLCPNGSDDCASGHELDIELTPTP